MDKNRINELVLEIQNGSVDSFGELYQITYDNTKIIVRSFVSNESDVEDLIQDCYVKLINKINTLKNPVAFKSWFNVMVCNISKNHLNKKRPDLFCQYEKNDCENDFDTYLEEKSTDYLPIEWLEKNEISARVKSCLDNLSEEQRICVVMHYFCELKVDEIAEILGISRNTVISRLNYARKKLKKELQQDKDEKMFGVFLFPLLQTSLDESLEQKPLVKAQTYKKIIATKEAKKLFGFSVTKSFLLKGSALSTLQKIATVVLSVAIVGGVVAGLLVSLNDSKNNESSDNIVATIIDVSKEESIITSGILFAYNDSYLICNKGEEIAKLNIANNEWSTIMQGNAKNFVIVNDDAYFIANGQLWSINLVDSKTNYSVVNTDLYVAFVDDMLYTISNSSIDIVDDKGQIAQTESFDGSYLRLFEDCIYYYNSNNDLIQSKIQIPLQNQAIILGVNNDGMRFDYQISNKYCAYPSFDSNVTGNLNLYDLNNENVKTITLQQPFVDVCVFDNGICYSAYDSGTFLADSEGVDINKIYDTNLEFVGEDSGYCCWYDVEKNISLFFNESTNKFEYKINDIVTNFAILDNNIFYETTTYTVTTLSDLEKY